MSKSLTKTFVAGLLTMTFVSGTASAQTTLSVKIGTALGNKNLAEVQSLLATGPGNVDEVIKALLKKTQSVMATDPEFSDKMMSLATQYAAQITPPSVPVVCADVRRIVESIKPEQSGTPLYKAVMTASDAFSKAPVVVAAGRPNECEQAWLQANKVDEEALLAQTPGMRGPGLPPTTVRPGIPPTDATPTNKASAD